MKKIPTAMLIRAMKEITYKNKHGHWLGGNIPQVLYGIRDMCYFGSDFDNWESDVEELIMEEMVEIMKAETKGKDNDDPI